MQTRRAKCPHCGREVLYAPVVVKRKPDKSVYCVICDVYFRPVAQSSKGNDARKRSNDQEKRAAKRNEARIQPGSGSLSGAKSDVLKEGEMRMECKHTTKSSISLKQEWLRKVAKEAAAGEIPVLEIEFQGSNPYERYVVVNSRDFEIMLRDHKEMNEMIENGDV